MTVTLTADEARIVREGLYCISNYWSSSADKWEVRTPDEDSAIDPHGIALHLRDKAAKALIAFGKIGC